ncbi:MAG: hypothetical protein FWH05_03590 [Oscillospiraceae bacterium]|nr:hypothetical protein [Oscillospiraceae bacterium]
MKNKNFFLGVLGIIAVISGAIITLLLLKDKFRRRGEFDFDEFDEIFEGDDEEFEHFFDTDDEFMDGLEGDNEPIIEG